MTHLQLSPELSGSVESIEEKFKSLVISTVEQRNTAVETIKVVKEKRGQIVSFFADSKQKAHAAWKSIVAGESGFTDKLDVVESGMKRAIQAFDREQENKRIADQARLQKAADDAAAAERARLEKEASKLKTPAIRAERQAMAASVTAPVIRVAPVVIKAQGEQTRKTWKHRVTDPLLVPREFLLVNDSALAAFAKSTKGATKVAGVEFFEDQILAFR